MSRRWTAEDVSAAQRRMTGQSRVVEIAAPTPSPEGKTPRKCMSCGKVFVPRQIGGRHKGNYCSRGCVAARGKVTRSCDWCTKPFTSIESAAQKFCSHSCATSQRNWKGGPEQRTCAACGKIFEAFPSQPEKCCSRECSIKVKEPLLGAANPNWRGGNIVRACLHCGKEFQGNPKRISRQLYCSNDCVYAARFGPNANESRYGDRFGHHGPTSGKREDIGIYVRSSWEANYARYLNLLVKMGAIKQWEYEAETFEFPVRRGTRFYTPDFRIHMPDGSVEFHEVKGWMTPKSVTTLKRMAKYHPAVRIVLIRKAEYVSIKSKWRNAIPMWELGPGRGNP